VSHFPDYDHKYDISVYSIYKLVIINCFSLKYFRSFFTHSKLLNMALLRPIQIQ
jgi:hypothetical protein